MAQIIMTDGANTKTLNPWDLESNPDAWTFLSNAPQRELDDMFYKVAASFRAINKRAIAAANVPFQIMQGKTVVNDSKHWDVTKAGGFMRKPKDIIRRVSMSLTFTNAAYLLQGRDVLHQVKGLHFLVPTTIRPITDPATGEIDYFERVINGRVERIAANDPKLVKIWLLDHTTELLPSRHTSAQAIFNSVGGVYFQDLFIRNFYERGGVKPSLIALKGAVFNEKKEEIERGWNRFVRNLSKFSTKIMNADTMDIKPFGAGVDDFKNNEIYKQGLENIALGIGMPISELMSDFDSFATAQVDRMSWQRDDIFPHCESIAEDLNEQVFVPLGLYLDFKTETTDAETQDEVDRAEAYERYVGAGIKPSVAAQIVSIELPDGVEYEDLDKMAEEKKAEEDAKAKADQQHALDLQAAKQPAGTSPKLAEDKPSKPAKVLWMPTLDEFKELKVWQEVALRRHKKAESMDFEYQPHYGGLNEAMTAQIKAALLTAKSVEEIKAAFDVQYETTSTPVPAYKAATVSPDIMALAESINKLAAVELKKLTATNTDKEIIE